MWTGGEVGMTEIIAGIAVGVFGIISIFLCGYEFGKLMGLRKAEKLFDESIKKSVGKNDG